MLSANTIWKPFAAPAWIKIRPKAMLRPGAFGGAVSETGKARPARRGIRAGRLSFDDDLLSL